MGTEYPKREKFFAMKVGRLLLKSCAANEIGPDGCWLVKIIALTEDAAKYRRAVTYYDDQLSAVLGVSRQSLVRVRRRVVEHGWLNYSPGRKRVPGRYFVTVPNLAKGLPDTPTDEGDESYFLSQSGTETESIAVSDFDRKRTESVQQPDRKRTESDHLSYLHLKPKPIPPPKSPKGGLAIQEIQLPENLNTPEFLEAWESWKRHRTEKRKNLTPESVRKQYAEMSGWGPDRSIAAINHSIAKGWQGIFEPKQANGQPRQHDLTGLKDFLQGSGT